MLFHPTYVMFLVKILFYLSLFLTSSLFFFLHSKPLFLVLLLLFCSIFLLLSLLIVSTHTMSNIFPVLHSIHLLSAATALLYLFFFFSCPYLKSVAASPISETSSFPAASLHSSLNGSYSLLLASSRSDRCSFAPSCPRFFYRKRFAFLFFFCLLLSGDVELNPGPSSSNSDNLSFATLNIRSASSVTDDLDKPVVLRDFILCNSLDILLLTETWL